MYNAHFNFREAPFGVTPDPQFYYSNAVYQEAWATLRYGIEARKGFILITGEAGTGKTTLLRKAMRAFGSNIKTAYIPNTLVGYTDLLRLMLTDLGLPVSTDNKSMMIERLTEYLIEQFKAGNIVALLVDEAQNLRLETLEELRLLGNLETDKDKLLQIVLVGQPELEQKLDQSELRQLKQRLVLRCRLKPVTRDEVESYMDSRLQTIGHRSEDLFDPDAVERVALYSAGIPRLINIICDNALLAAFALSKLKISAAIVDEVAEDLRLGDSRIQQDVRAQALTSPFEGKESSEFAPGPQNKRVTKEEPLFVDSGDRPMGLHKDGIPSYRDTHHWFRPIIGVSATIVMLTGLGILLYSYKLGFSISGSSSDSTAAVDSGRKGIDRVELAASALDAKTPSIIRQATIPAPRIQAVAVSDQNISTGRPEKAIAASAAVGNVHQVATVVSVREVQKAEAPGRRDNEEKSTSSANFLVVGPSFVRDKPTYSAAIIATLEPGTRITVAGQTGEYYRIRSLGTEVIRGYVHKEDAFFERES